MTWPKTRTRTYRQRGRGLDIQKWLGKTEIEFHWPGYQFMGPGTRLAKRLKRGDPGINWLEKIAKQCDSQESERQMESRYENDQGHRKVTREQNAGQKDCEENHAGQVISLWSSCYSIKVYKRNFRLFYFKQFDDIIGGIPPITPDSHLLLTTWYRVVPIPYVHPFGWE